MSAPGQASAVPPRLRLLEPFACLALAGHAVAVQAVAEHRWAPVIAGAAVVLLLLGLVGLAGARSTGAVSVRCLAVLVLGTVLQALRADSSGYFLLWFFVLVSVYPLVLPHRVGRLVPVLTPAAYLALVPVHAVDGSDGIALLRALSLGVIGVFVHQAAAAYRGVAEAHDDTRALLDTFVAAAPVGLAFWDTDERFRRVNDAFAELTGLPAAEHLGRRPAEVPGLPDVVAEHVRAVLAGGGAVGGLTITSGVREWNAGVYPVLRAGTLSGAGAVVVEVTREREVACQLAHSEAAAQEALTTLQRALLPPEVMAHRGVTVAARYRAAGIYDRVGGDWYDTIALPSGGLALVIGDVEGHDLTAASVMGLVRGAVRSYALEGHPPSIVMERVSAFLLSTGIERLVTMAYVQLYPHDAIATVVLAGHPAPLVVPPGGPAQVLDVRPGPLLGVEELTRWEERTVSLPRDAALVLYTDGLLSHPAATGDQLDRLTALAASAAGRPVDVVADTLISAAVRYDDAAVLAARVELGRTPALRRTFPAQPISAGIARTWLTDLFDMWQASGVLEAGQAVRDHLDAAQLLLTELVSNAVRHSDQSVDVRVELVERRLRVEVADTSERMPVMREPEAAVTEGRGLRLVDALSTAWGVQLNPQGKVVWFERHLDVGSEDVDEDKVLAAFGDLGC